MQDITVYKLQQKGDGHVHIILYMTGVVYQHLSFDSLACAGKVLSPHLKWPRVAGSGALGPQSTIHGFLDALHKVKSSSARFAAQPLHAQLLQSSQLRKTEPAFASLQW